jgi:hypothetical protein
MVILVKMVLYLVHHRRVNVSVQLDHQGMHLFDYLFYNNFFICSDAGPVGDKGPKGKSIMSIQILTSSMSQVLLFKFILIVSRKVYCINVLHNKTQVSPNILRMFFEQTPTTIHTKYNECDHIIQYN